MSRTCRRFLPWVFVLALPFWANAGDVRQPTESAWDLATALGSSAFSERQRAARELARMGGAARAALEASINSSDAEVRARARVILKRLDQTEFRDRLEAFIADHNGRLGRTLPGWEQFQELCGTSPTSRALFVVMQRAEPELMAAFGQGPAKASEGFQVLCQTLFDDISMRTSYRDTITGLGTTVSLLFVGSSDGVNVGEQQGMHVSDWLTSPQFQQQVRKGPYSFPLRRILGAWILKDCVPQATPQHFGYAAAFGLRDEGLVLATRILSNHELHMNAFSPPNIRFFALQTLGRFGTLADAPVAEIYLADPTPCGNAQVGDPPRQAQLQIRDVALSVVVKLTDQSIEDYGMPVQRTPYPVFQTTVMAFADQESRDTALLRYHRWRADNPVDAAIDPVP